MVIGPALKTILFRQVSPSHVAMNVMCVAAPPAFGWKSVAHRQRSASGSSKQMGTATETFFFAWALSHCRPCCATSCLVSDDLELPEPPESPQPPSVAQIPTTAMTARPFTVWELLTASRDPCPVGTAQDRASLTDRDQDDEREPHAQDDDDGALHNLECRMHGAIVSRFAAGLHAVGALVARQ